jgi:phosphonate transport system ATP-binding protein
VFDLKQASASYNGRVVLRDISLTVRPGERVALVGESGSGKSTLLNLLYQQHQARAALVPQDPALVRTLSVFHNVYIGCLHRHKSLYNLLNLVRPRSGEVESVRPILRRLGIEDKIFTPAGELSGGQQQRTSVARALCQGRDVLLGDEPVSAVDVHQARAVLTAINEAHGTVILAMHDVDLALAFTDRVIGLKGGHIALDSPSLGLKQSDLDSLYKN